MPETLSLHDRGDGVVMAIRVQPGARKAGVVGVHNGAIKVAVTAPPEHGKANAALLRLLADVLGLSRGQLEVIRGVTARDKLVLVRHISQSELLERLHRVLPEPQ